MAAGQDPSSDVLGELLHWADLLRTFKWRPSPALRDVMVETLTLRGLLPDVVTSVLDDLISPAAIPGSPAPGEAARPARSIARGLVPPIGWRGSLWGDSAQALPLESAFLRFTLPLVVLLGLILRVWLSTTQSAWLDEAWSLQQMARAPLDTLYSAVKSSDTKSPLYYGLLHVWVGLTGFGVIQARLLSVVFGVATIPVLYLLAKLLFDKTTALVAALLLAISPIATWYSDEIRMYAATGLFALLAVYLLLRAAGDQKSHWWLGYALCTALAISFDPSGVYLPLAVNLFYLLLLVRRQAPLWPWLASNALAVLLALPALLLLRFQMSDHVGEIGWIPMPTFSIVWSSVLDMVSLNGQSFWTGLAVEAFAILGVLCLLHDRRDRSLRRAYLLLAFLIIIPVAVPLAASVFHPVFLTRTVQTAVYGLLILLARGIVMLLRTRLPAGVLALVAIAGLNAASLHAAAATTLKENWKDLVWYASRQISSDSLIVFDPFWLLNPFNLYWQSYNRQVAQYSYPPITSERRAAQVFQGARSVWLVTDDTGDNPPVDAGTAYLQSQYQRMPRTWFFGLSLRHYVAPATKVTVDLRAQPSRVKDGASTLVRVTTTLGAICALKIVYDTDHGAPGWVGAPQPADNQGGVAWLVRVVTKANAGTATTSCSLGGYTAVGQARLFVAH